MADTATAIPIDGGIATNLDKAQAVLAAFAEAHGDTFRVKVQRRTSLAAPPEAIAIFDEATVSHLMNPEPWLAKFAGGGNYYHLRVVHSKDIANDRPIAMYQINAIPGASKTPDRNVMRSSDWNGPRVCYYAAGDEARVAEQMKRPEPAVAAPPSGATPTTSGTSDGGLGLLLIMQQQNERAEARHREEMELLRRSMDDDRKRSETVIATALSKLNTPAPIQPRAEFDPTKLVTIIGAIGGALAPVMAMISESRKAEREAAQRREEMERDRAAKQEERTQGLMEKLATSSAEQGKVISVFTDSLAQTARAMVQTVAMVGELRQPEQAEPGIVDLLKAGIGAYVEASSAAAARGAQPALPPSAPTTPVAPAATRPPPEGGDAFAEAQPEGVPVETILGSLADAISKRIAIDDLAPDVVDALADPAFVEGVRSEGGLLGVLRKRLPETWGADAENATYVRDLSAKIAGLASSKGIPRATLEMLFQR